MKAYAGEPDQSPKAFLAQYYLYAWRQNVPVSERAPQLIGKVTWPRPDLVHPHVRQRRRGHTKSQIALDLRKAFRQEYTRVWALSAMFHVTAQPTQSGAQRLFALDRRKEQAPRSTKLT